VLKPQTGGSTPSKHRPQSYGPSPSVQEFAGSAKSSLQTSGQSVAYQKDAVTQTPIQGVDSVLEYEYQQQSTDEQAPGSAETSPQCKTPLRAQHRHQQQKGSAPKSANWKLGLSPIDSAEQHANSYSVVGSPPFVPAIVGTPQKSTANVGEPSATHQGTPQASKAAQMLGIHGNALSPIASVNLSQSIGSFDETDTSRASAVASAIDAAAVAAAAAAAGAPSGSIERATSPALPVPSSSPPSQQQHYQQQHYQQQQHQQQQHQQQHQQQQQ
jgi:hypothetical protein